MDNTAITLLFIVSVVVLLLAVAFFGYLYQRIYIPNRYVWLGLLDREDWRTTLQLRQAMRQQVGIEGLVLVERDLERLEDEDLIDCQPHEDDDESELNEYQLTMAGWKKLLEMRHPERSRAFPRTV